MAKEKIERTRIVTVNIESTAPYSASRNHGEPKNADESHEEYDARTWRHKLTYLPNGQVIIPGPAFKLGLDFTAGVKGQKVEGRGAATYKKLFTTGVMVLDDAHLGLDVNDDEHIKMDRIFVNLDGIRGSSKRGFRYFPRINAWSSEVKFMIVNPDIPTQVFLDHIAFMGLVCGVGRFRPEKGGSNGRFKVTGHTIEQVAE